MATIKSTETGKTVPVGFCMRNELQLSAEDLRTSQWDMCGDVLIDE